MRKGVSLRNGMMFATIAMLLAAGILYTSRPSITGFAPIIVKGTGAAVKYDFNLPGCSGWCFQIGKSTTWTQVVYMQSMIYADSANKAIAQELQSAASRSAGESIISKYESSGTYPTMVVQGLTTPATSTGPSSTTPGTQATTNAPAATSSIPNTWQYEVLFPNGQVAYYKTANGEDTSPVLVYNTETGTWVGSDLFTTKDKLLSNTKTYETAGKDENYRFYSGAATSEALQKITQDLNPAGVGLVNAPVPSPSATPPGTTSATATSIMPSQLAPGKFADYTFDDGSQAHVVKVKDGIYTVTYLAAGKQDIPENWQDLGTKIVKGKPVSTSFKEVYEDMGILFMIAPDQPVNDENVKYNAITTPTHYAIIGGKPVPWDGQGLENGKLVYENIQGPDGQTIYAAKLNIKTADGQWHNYVKDDEGNEYIELNTKDKDGNPILEPKNTFDAMQTAGPFLNNLASDAAAGRYLSVLFGMDNSNWRRTWDTWFVHNVLGSTIAGNWEESLCHHYIDRAPEGTLYLEIPDGSNMIGVGAHIEAERSGGTFTNESGTFTEFLYKISIFVSNPSQATVRGQAYTQQLDFNVELKGQRTVRLFQATQPVGPGASFSRAGGSIIVQRSSFRYDVICIEFVNSIYTANGDTRLELCNTITEYAGGPTAVPAVAASSGGSGSGSSGTNQI
jgi:hypothetical protein